jgi:hypothetical protein
LTAWVAAVAGAQLVALLATSTRYGYHRDELYFIVAGGHPALGYPDQPPLVPLICRAMYELAPGSLFLLRLPSALAAVTTTVLASLVAREVGGGRRAQLIAAGCTAASGVALAVGHFVTTTTFDVLSTTAVGWLVLRGVVRGAGPSMLAAGVAVGVGGEAKPQVALVALVLFVVLLAAGPRQAVRSWWTAGGVAAAVVIIAPYAVWQQLHGWPQLTVARHIGGSAEGGRVGFIPFQLVMVSPVLVPVWVAGLVAPFRRAAWRPLRFLPITYAALALLYLAGDGKAYYLASLYPVLLGLGATPTADWTARTRLRLGLVTGAIAVSAVISAFIALPLLPERSLQGSAVMALNPDQGETVGWPRFVDTIASAWRSIPPAKRSRTVIFTSNYGEAGAVDLLGRSRGLPRAYSGHNGFSEWGHPPDVDRNALLLGYSLDGAGPYFTGCRRLATIDDGVGLDNDEQGGPVLLCRTTAPWSALWPHLRHYE